MATRINGCGGRRRFILVNSAIEDDYIVLALSTGIISDVGLEPFLLLAFVRRLGSEGR